MKLTLHTIDSISICMMKFGVENPCLYEMAAMFLLSFFRACFLIYKVMFVPLIRETSATVLMKLQESWPLP